MKLLGAEVGFSEEGARRLAADADKIFDEFRGEADVEFQRQAHLQDLRRKLELVFRSSSPEISDDDDIRACAKKPHFRCAIHVPHILFTDTLYQLLDYYPKQKRGGAGRRFSTRFGIIGRAWRLYEHQGEGTAAHSKEDLVREWGMTDEEAETHSRQRPAYICAVLKEPRGLPLGVLFLDSTESEPLAAAIELLLWRVPWRSKRKWSVSRRHSKRCGMNSASTARQSESTLDVRLGSYADLAAEYYDSKRHPTCANFREASAVFLAEELSTVSSREGLLAEIGAGQSLVAELLPIAASQRRLVLIDMSCEMLAHSMSWLSAGALGIIADAHQLPVRDGYFELVVVALGDPFNDQKAWYEIARVLRPEGLCLFSVPAFAWAEAFRANVGRMDLAEFATANSEILALPSFIMPPERQREMIENAGLAVLRQRTITLGEIVLTPWSPKLLPSRGADGEVIDAFAIAPAGRRPFGS
jgi:ubiquinone/menaquinone biosynthesis C-methylase UbiE